MLHDLLAMDLTGFDVRAVPHTAAKAQQQERFVKWHKAWLRHVLQEGAIGCKAGTWLASTISKDEAYESYKEFSKQQNDYRPEIKDLWSKNNPQPYSVQMLAG